TASAMVFAANMALAENKITGAAKDAIDPNCTVDKAVKGAAMKATVGVGNRCGVKETAKDVSGVEDKVDNAKDSLSN
ncbi:MAG: hypothetical protein AAGJ35_11010, partial [Myxococcota bacterium]